MTSCYNCQSYGAGGRLHTTIGPPSFVFLHLDQAAFSFPRIGPQIWHSFAQCIATCIHTHTHTHTPALAKTTKVVKVKRHRPRFFGVSLFHTRAELHFSQHLLARAYDTSVKSHSLRLSSLLLSLSSPFVSRSCSNSSRGV